MAKKTFQSSSTTTVSMSGDDSHAIITFIITIILVYCIYNYVRGLENCDCVNQKLVDRIKNIELFLLVAMVLGLITSIFNTKFVSHSYHALILFVLLGLCMLYIGIELYLIYEVYNLRKTLPKNCECADKWQLKLLYVQCVWYAIAAVLFIFSLYNIRHRITNSYK